MSKNIKYISKISTNAIFSESKKQRKTTRGGGNWGKRGVYSRPLLIALLIANALTHTPYSWQLLIGADGCLLINYWKKMAVSGLVPH